MVALSITDLRKTYKGGFEALKGISLDVKEGEFFGLLGPNGAGKTTTIGIVTSLTTKTAGKVSVLGIDIDQDFPGAKRMIGVVPQEFNFSIFERVQDIVCQQAGNLYVEACVALEFPPLGHLKQIGIRHRSPKKVR